MKRLCTGILAILMTFSLAACGGEVTLSDKTANGISISLPDGFEEFQDNGGYAVAQGPNGSISIQARQDAGGLTSSQIDQATFARDIIGAEQAEFLSYDNNVTCAGVPAIRANIKDAADGVSFVTYCYMLFHEDQTYQLILIASGDDNGSVVNQNIDAITASIKIV